ncbi:hypothetical protein D910_10913 [Dendroctonus ponderosae]|uniref:ABC transmembrane type-1 domain-containing protein n=1 Tax=Dendroctonus ponderosae TaxID=77166 RepID=U4UTZ3_DENPD|nr:hypothetical protein D910_10913 [Dendroctonus ponderosae]
MFIGFLIFLNTFLIKMTQPIVLGRYIKYFEKSSTRDATTGWSLGSGVILLAFLNMVAMHYTIVNCSRLLRLNHISSGKTAAGQLVNLLSNDVVRFDFALAFLHYIWIMPLQGIAGLIVMYSYIQTAAFPTMLVMTIQAVLGQGEIHSLARTEVLRVSSLSGYLSRLQGKFRGKIATLTDQRVKLMNEITSGIQVIKMYAWEKPFEKIVEFSRRKEVNMIARNSYIRGFSSALNIFVERATLYIAVISYVLLGNRITVAQLLNTIQLYMSIFFPLAHSSYEEAKVSVRRIEEFLTMEEIPALTYSDDELEKDISEISKEVQQQSKDEAKEEEAIKIPSKRERLQSISSVIVSGGGAPSKPILIRNVLEHGGDRAR